MAADDRLPRVGVDDNESSLILATNLMANQEAQPTATNELMRGEINCRRCGGDDCALRQLNEYNRPVALCSNGWLLPNSNCCFSCYGFSLQQIALLLFVGVKSVNVARANNCY